MFKAWQRLKEAWRPSMRPSNLVAILQEMEPARLLDERVLALRDLMAWIRLPVTGHEENQSRNIRFKFFLQFLQNHPKEKQFFVETLRELLGQGVAVRLYCMTGVAENTGFFSELGDRLVLRLLPHLSSERDLAELFQVIFTEEEDADWLENSSELIMPAMLKIIQEHKIPMEGLGQEINEALIILGAQISSIGVSRAIRRRLRTQSLADSPFVRLNKTINSNAQNREQVLQEIEQCRLQITRVRERAETTGVSVDLIYNLERLNALLNRTTTLIQIQQDSTLIGRFMAALVRAEIRRQGVREFLSDNLKMLAKKIVERAGEKGEHYIASTPQELRGLFVAASWAGVLTAFTALLKVLIGFFPFPLFIAFFLYFCNYALGFLLMQRWHLALSSKQPAFTASALSRKFEEFMASKELTPVAQEIRKISYSQFLAALANLLCVIPVISLIDWGYFAMSGQHILSQSEAHRVISHHGLHTSGTLFYAAFTGVLLWASSVVSGWCENWIVFRNVPQILAESVFLNNYLGKERARRFSEKFASVAGAASGNLAIAFLLAAPYTIGKFVGLPLDIRHVTLAAGTITLALNSLTWDMSIIPILISMGLSILVMGVLNFGVSFYCSIRMAALARSVPARYLRIIFRNAFKRRPTETLK
jgi:site-specific recombinase